MYFSLIAFFVFETLKVIKQELIEVSASVQKLW